VAEARVAVLASGEGTNLQALLDDPVVSPWIVLVLSDRAEAGALRRARSRGIRSEHLDPAGYADRSVYDRAIVDVLRSEGVDLVALAGFMRIVGPELVGAFEGRMVNVHPALLPSFPGTRAVADALEWGVKLTGVTVHLVDEQVDHGPVLFQEAIEVHDDDTWDSLESRVHEVEHRLLPAAVRALAEGRAIVEGRRVRILAESDR